MKKNLRLLMLTLLCAVFGTAWGETYQKVTSSSGLTSGTYLIVNEENSVAFDGSLGTLDAVGNLIEVTINNGTISANSQSSFEIDVENGTIKSASGFYIGRTSDSNGLNSSATTAYTNTISIDSDGNAVILSSGGAYLRYNQTSNQARFRYYRSSSYTGQKAIQLYKKSGGSTSTATQTTTTITVPTNFNKDLANGTTAGQLTASVTANGTAISGATVTWSSSNTDVAKVDANGNVTLVAAGTTNIVASYAGVENQYKPSQGVCEFTVTNSNFVAYPTFNPASGAAVAAGSNVTITAEEGCTLSYTVNGVAQTSTTNTASVTINEATTIVAKAVRGSYESAEVTATYTVFESVPGYIIDFERDLNSYTDWTFTNIERKKQASDILAHGGTYYGTTTSSGNATYTASVATKNKIAAPTSLTFYYTKCTGNNNASSLFKIQISSDGSSWTDVASGLTMNNVTKGTWYELSAILTDYSDVYVRVYYDGTNAIRGIDDIELVVGTAKAEPELEFSEESVSYEIGQTEEFSEPSLSYADGFDGTITYSSSDTDVATVNPTTGEVTILNVAGSTTITASSAATENFKAGEASYTIVVTDPNATEHTATYLFEQSPYTTDYGSGVDVTSDSNYYIYDSKTWTSGDVTLVTSGKYRWHTNAMGNDPLDLRFYNNTTDNPSKMVFSVPENNLITKIEMTGETLTGWQVDGDYQSTSSRATWTGNTREVVFTTSTKIFVETVTVTYVTSTPTPTENVIWMTYCSERNLNFTNNKDVTAYIVYGYSEDERQALLSKITQVRAGTGIMVKANGTSSVSGIFTPDYVADNVATDDDYSGIVLTDNFLVGVTTSEPLAETGKMTYEDKEVDCYNFVLAKNNGVVGFYKSSGNGNIAANKAYLQLPQSMFTEEGNANGISFVIDGEETAIKNVNTRTNSDDVWYTLQGVRVAQPNQSGIYIRNGQKIVVK